MTPARLVALAPPALDTTTQTFTVDIPAATAATTLSLFISLIGPTSPALAHISVMWEFPPLHELGSLYTQHSASMNKLTTHLFSGHKA